MNLQTLPAVIRRDVPNARFPALYEAAKTALAKCVRIDECKEWSDKAAALATYARQANDTKLEDDAKRIRLRALESAGELLLKIKSGAGRKGQGRASAASAAGFSVHEAYCATRIARTPSEIRNPVIDGPRPPNVGSKHQIERAFPRVGAYHGFVGSAAYRSVMNANGVTAFASFIRKTATSVAGAFTLEEAERIRPYLVEIAEWVDEFEHRLPKQRKPS